MTIQIRTVEFNIDNGPAMTGEISAHQDMQRALTDLPKPDERWEFTDSNGHYHAYSNDTEQGDHYPTLNVRSEHVDCDGSCGGVCDGEGYNATRYSCRICEEEIQPGSVAGPHAFTVPGLKSWRVVVDGFVDRQKLVSVRVQYDDEVLFGVAEWSSHEQYFDGAEVRTRTELIGVNPLGRRKP